jgi:hypothetical protein
VNPARPENGESETSRWIERNSEETNEFWRTVKGTVLTTEFHESIFEVASISGTEGPPPQVASSSMRSRSRLASPNVNRMLPVSALMRALP